jgi:hypothetical protein
MGQNTLNQAIVQKIVVDSNNSSTTNLSVSNSYTFTGTISSSLAFSGIQVALFADQNCTVSIEQSTNSTPNWDIVDTFDYLANESFGVTVTSQTSFFRIVVSTVGNATTTAFRLQTCLCPIADSLPRAVDEDGNLRVGIKSIEDEYGFASENTPTDEIRIAEVCRQSGSVFDLNGNAGAVDANFWTAVVANNGSITQANGTAILDTTTSSANGSAVLSSVRRARYVSGSANRYRGVLTLNNSGATNNVRRWGVAYGSGFPATPTITDGLWFQLNGTQFSVNSQLANGTINSVTSFNGKMGAAYTHDFTVAHTYEIYWTNTSAWFTVDGELLHKMTGATNPLTATKSFYIYHSSVNSGGLQTSNVLTLRTASIHRMGKEQTAPQRVLVTTANTYNFKYGPGMLQRIVIGTTSGTLMTIYDDTTGTTNVMLSIGAFNTGAQGAVCLDVGLPFFNGLKVVSTGTWSAAFIYE